MDYAVFIPACFALNLAFGPNNLLALQHGTRGGIVFAQKAGLGRLAVFVPMIAVSALGLGLVLSASATLFNALKIAGAIYLVWLGIRLWRNAAATGVDAGSETHGPNLGRAFRAEASVAIANPKAILIFAAFFPQFVDVETYWTSYAVLGGLFLALEAAALTLYAVAGRLAARAAARRLPVMQRISGLAMGVFGALLLASPAPSRG